LFQLVEISASALPEPPLAAGLELAAADAEVDAGVLGVVEDEELELLEQAAIAVTRIRPSAGAR
jgi:hypothetical protein